jgi:1-acyl-sn-glycerol-3-phosphate acyltransferase
MFRTAFFVTIFIPWTLFVIFTGVPLSFIRSDYLHSYARFWAKISLRLAGVRLSVKGIENIPTDRPIIYMPNHQSNFDILALFAGLPGQFRWLAKEELFHIPLLGMAMRRTGYIPVNRSDRRKAIQGMAEAVRRITEGTSVIIFPEGTRSPDGTLLPFKKGGFIMALQSQVPVVPVAIRGSRDIMPKHSLLIQGGGDIRVDILPALETKNRPVSDRDALMEEVRRPLEAALGERLS